MLSTTPDAGGGMRVESAFERVRDLPAWTRLSLPYWERVISERRIPVYRVGRAVLVKRADVEAYIARGFEPARNPEADGAA